MKQHYNIRIYGQVQGVGFRAATIRKATALGLTGWVRNESDGTVSIEAEGESDALKRFIVWCHEGPPGAVVERAEKQLGTVKHFKGFSLG